MSIERENMKRKKSREGRIVSINISPDKGTKKTPTGSGHILEGYGLEDDGHGGDWHRQVSLLAEESINKMKTLGLDVGPGDFAENLTTKGLNLVSLPVGTEFAIGDEVLLKVTQIGKECHNRCAIYYQAGDCIMPKEGIFARVLRGGLIKVGDKVKIMGNTLPI